LGVARGVAVEALPILTAVTSRKYCGGRKTAGGVAVVGSDGRGPYFFAHGGVAHEIVRVFVALDLDLLQHAVLSIDVVAVVLPHLW
jgi:hypothetical protein